jgi:TetR/AcrR family transcriptional repressor of nem operon
MAGRNASRSVGRPREFDEDVVLEAAMDAFWTNGYEATSLADLCKATGLHKGSLYQSFGDKHELFMRALHHYSDKEFRDVMAVAFDSESPLENIRAVIHKVCESVDECKGCLVINSMVELAPHNPAVKEAVNSFGEKRLRVMAEMIGKAQQAGEIWAELVPEVLAAQLMVLMAGVAATTKSLIGSKESVELLDLTIDLWT